MKNSKGDYFVFLDSDDQLMPLALEFRMSMIKKYDAEIVYTRGLRDIYEKRDNGYALVNNTTYWTCGFNRDLLLIQNIVQCNSVLFSRNSWDDTNNYKLDSGLFTGEDFDFWQELSRKNDFIELKLLDCNCSYRLDGNQMTGVRNFAADLPRIYGKRRHTAINKNYVIDAQNSILRQSNIDPTKFGL
jgi:glycosyltransferase involved in cell wall biosynthesis